MSSQVVDSGRHTVFPNDGVSGADIPNGNTARTRNTNDLALVIDCGSSAGAITRQWQQLAHFAIWFPDHGPELEDLESGITALDRGLHSLPSQLPGPDCLQLLHSCCNHLGKVAGLSLSLFPNETLCRFSR